MALALTRKKKCGLRKARLKGHDREASLTWRSAHLVTRAHYIHGANQDLAIVAR